MRSSHLFLFCVALAGAKGQEPMPTRVKTTVSPLAIKVMVDGELIDFHDTSPIMAGSRVLVPLRGVFERMDATVDWDKAARTVTAHHGSTEIKLPIGSSQAQVGGKAVALDQPAMVIDGRTFVPLRFLSQSLGATVDWQTADRTVDIRTAG